MLPIAYIIVILCGAAGLALADYIRRKKAADDKLICPAGSDCEVVIYSKHSAFLGIPVETLGGIYYLLITLSYTFFLFFPNLNFDMFSFGIILLTIIAFFFSIYLTFVQMMVLGQWCVWCLFSAMLCIIIFIIVWAGTELNLIEFINTATSIF